MHDIRNLKDMLCSELEEYGRKGEMTAGSLDVVDKLAHAVKNLNKILEHEEGYSNGSYRGTYKGSYARRDSRGRYSSDGYSRAAEDITSQLRSMIEQAPNDMTKRELEKLVEKMEQM